MGVGGIGYQQNSFIPQGPLVIPAAGARPSNSAAYVALGGPAAYSTALTAQYAQPAPPLMPIPSSYSASPLSGEGNQPLVLSGQDPQNAQNPPAPGFMSKHHVAVVIGASVAVYGGFISCCVPGALLGPAFNKHRGHMPAHTYSDKADSENWKLRKKSKEEAFDKAKKAYERLCPFVDTQPLGKKESSLTYPDLFDNYITIDQDVKENHGYWERVKASSFGDHETYLGFRRKNPKNIEEGHELCIAVPTSASKSVGEKLTEKNLKYDKANKNLFTFSENKGQQKLINFTFPLPKEGEEDHFVDILKKLGINSDELKKTLVKKGRIAQEPSTLTQALAWHEQHDLALKIPWVTSKNRIKRIAGILRYRIKRYKKGFMEASANPHAMGDRTCLMMASSTMLSSSLAFSVALVALAWSYAHTSSSTNQQGTSSQH